MGFGAGQDAVEAGQLRGRGQIDVGQRRVPALHSHGQIRRLFNGGSEELFGFLSEQGRELLGIVGGMEATAAATGQLLEELGVLGCSAADANDGQCDAVPGQLGDQIQRALPAALLLSSVGGVGEEDEVSQGRV